MTRRGYRPSPTSVNGAHTAGCFRGICVWFKNMLGRPSVVDPQINDGKPMKKMSPEECTRQIVVALEKNRDEANFGMTSSLRLMESISSTLAKAITLKF